MSMLIIAGSSYYFLKLYVLVGASANAVQLVALDVGQLVACRDDPAEHVGAPEAGRHVRGPVRRCSAPVPGELGRDAGPVGERGAGGHAPVRWAVPELTGDMSMPPCACLARSGRHHHGALSHAVCLAVVVWLGSTRSMPTFL